MIYETYTELMDAYNEGEVLGFHQTGLHSGQRTELKVAKLDTGAAYWFYQEADGERMIDVFKGYQVDDEGYLHSSCYVGYYLDEYEAVEQLADSEVGVVL